MGKNLTRKDIAVACGFSPSTVSRALSGSPLLPQKTIARVREVAERLGYQPNILARRLASNRSFQIAYLLPSKGPRKGALQVTYFSTILDAMVSVAADMKYNVLIHPYDLHDTNLINDLTRLVRTKHVDGLAITGLTLDSEIPEALSKKKLPLVLIGTPPLKKSMLSVTCDPLPGIKQMLSCLRKRKYENLFYVHGNMIYHHAVAQRNALMEALKSSPIKLVDILPGDYSRKSGYHAAGEIIGRKLRKTAVFLSNDRMACGFYRYCYEHGVSIPGTVGVIGSDDEEEAAALFPDLSTIYQPRMEMGQKAVKLLISVLEKKKPRSVILSKKFIERNSLCADL